MKEPKSRHMMRFADTYAATRWIDDHRAEAATMTLPEIADAIAKSTGVAVTAANVRGICRANKFDWKANRRNLRSPDNMPPSKQTRFLAMQLRRVALQVAELYRQVGLDAPAKTSIDIEGLIRLSRGSNALLIEEDAE